MLLMVISCRGTSKVIFYIPVFVTFYLFLGSKNYGRGTSNFFEMASRNAQTGDFSCRTRNSPAHRCVELFSLINVD